VIQSIKTFAGLVSDKLWVRMVLGLGLALAIVAGALAYDWLYPADAVFQMLRKGEP